MYIDRRRFLSVGSFVSVNFTFTSRHEKEEKPEKMKEKSAEQFELHVCVSVFVQGKSFAFIKYS